jgi:hypothetical protein
MRIFALYAALMVASPLTAQQIKVGPNIQVSKDRGALEHGEAVICADPTNAQNLIAGSQVASDGGEIWSYGVKTGVVVYRSNDGGATWQYAFDTFGIANLAVDAACATGPDGTGHLSAMVAPASETKMTFDTDFHIYDYATSDGGRTWREPAVLPGTLGADRQFMVFDQTGGKYRGTEYISWMGSFDQKTIANERFGGALSLSHSRDGGRTWDFPAFRIIPPGEGEGEGAGIRILHNGNPVVLSDGTIVNVIGAEPLTIKVDSEQRYKIKIHVLRSTDGGMTLSPAVFVNDLHSIGTNIGVHFINSLGVDQSNAFRDRLYVTWNDDRSGRVQILLAHSIDGGLTWSAPVVVNDDAPFDAHDLGKGPHATAPWLTVNKDGIVGVMWLDRRDVPDNVGYNVRFAASLDGGETFTPSVKVSEKAMTPRPLAIVGSSRIGEKSPADKIQMSLGWAAWDFTGGDATFITADANGAFHPIWADARTRVRQLWTSSIHVSGTPRPFKSLIVGASADITSKATLEIESHTFKYDPENKTITADARIVNTSGLAIHAPLIVRVNKLSSSFADLVRVENADNGEHDIGAEWDFSSAIPNGQLAPHEKSAPKHLVFRLTASKPMNGGNMEYGHMLNLDATVHTLAEEKK